MTHLPAEHSNLIGSIPELTQLVPGEITLHGPVDGDAFQIGRNLNKRPVKEFRPLRLRIAHQVGSSVLLDVTFTQPNDEPFQLEDAAGINVTAGMPEQHDDSHHLWRGMDPPTFLRFSQLPDEQWVCEPPEYADPSVHDPLMRFAIAMGTHGANKQNQLSS